MNQLFAIEQSEKTSDDYLTPRWVFDTLDLNFDLDVAAPPWDTHVPAKRKYTKADDGSMADWEGRVWMNPPYSDAWPWVRRFIEHAHGVALVPMAKTRWLDALWQASEGVVLSESGGEMYFEMPGKGRYRSMFPAIFFAFGDECVEAIGRLGRVR